MTVLLLLKEMEHFPPNDNQMNIPSIVFPALVALAVLPGCRQKNVGDSTGETNQNSQPKDTTTNPSSKLPGQAQITELSRKTESSSEQKDKPETGPHSYVNFERELKESLTRIPPPKSIEDYAAIEMAFQKVFVRRRDLLFSIPISHEVEKDRSDAWSALGSGEKPANNFLTGEQNKYAVELLNRYMGASQLEKLVIWETVRTRITGQKRGSETGEILLRIEMAKLLFSALGIKEQELFDAVNLKTRSANSEAESKASSAEEEIGRITEEQSKVAEKILEKHWKPIP